MPALKSDLQQSKAKESIHDRNVKSMDKHEFRPLNSLDLVIVLFCQVIFSYPCKYCCCLEGRGQGEQLHFLYFFIIVLMAYVQ